MTLAVLKLLVLALAGALISGYYGPSPAFLHRPALKRYALPRPLSAGEKLAKLVQKLPDLSQAAFPEMPEGGYDLVVIGSGPGGEAAAVYAAKLGKRVAIIEKKSAFGGPTGLTSKAVREAAKRICRAVDQVGGDRRRQVKGLWKRGFAALKTEAEVLQAVETVYAIYDSYIVVFICPSEGSAEAEWLRPVHRGGSAH